MQGFVKESDVKYSGYIKAAVLLTELSVASDKVLEYLNLSDSEKHKLRKAMQSLGKYDPNNIAHVRREQTVLHEALEYGKKKNILSDKTVLSAEERDKNHEMWKTVKNDPGAVAQILGAWLNAEEKK